MNKSLFAQLILVFIICQVLGLIVALNLIQTDQAVQIVSENASDPLNALALFGYIIVMTIVLLIGIKLLKGRFLLRFVEIAAVFSTSLIVFSLFVPDLYAFALAIILIALRLIFKENLMLRNVSSVIAVSAVGSLIGVSLSLIPILVFAGILFFYDLIAVFYLKHMVTLAENVTKRNLAFTVALPTKEHKFELGTGDLAIPLMVSSSILKFWSANLNLNFIVAIIVLIASLTGLIITVDYSTRHPGKALPALPLQVAAMFFMIILAKVFLG